jgi:hypothetical protein
MQALIIFKVPRPQESMYPALKQASAILGFLGLELLLYFKLSTSRPWGKSYFETLIKKNQPNQEREQLKKIS